MTLHFDSNLLLELSLLGYPMSIQNGRGKTLLDLGFMTQGHYYGDVDKDTLLGRGIWYLHDKVDNTKMSGYRYLLTEFPPVDWVRSS